MTNYKEEFFNYRADREKLDKAMLTITERDIRMNTKLMLDEEQEKAHKAYLREKRRIIANLQGLKVAIKVISNKQGVEINDSAVYRILNNTIEFIKKGEI